MCLNSAASLGKKWNLALGPLVGALKSAVEFAVGDRVRTVDELASVAMLLTVARLVIAAELRTSTFLS